MKELLNNGDFELWYTPEWPLYWEISNIAGACSQAYSGCWSVKLSPRDGSTLMQTVQVVAGEGYVLQFHLNHLEGNGLVAARVEWLDSGGGLIEMASEQVFEMIAGENLGIWKSYRIVVPPVPPDGCWARISLSGVNASVLLDAVRFGSD